MQAVLSTFDTEDETIIVLQYIDGTELRRLLAKHGPLPLAVTLTLLGQIASALGHMHGAQIFHRDLSTTQILVRLDPTPHAVVIDWGDCKVLGLKELYASTIPGVVGQAPYLAPEIQPVNPRRPASETEPRYSEQTDMFAFGVLAHVMLTSTAPFGGDPNSICERIATVDPGTLLRGIPGLPGFLRTKLVACLAADPNNRPSADEMCEALLGLHVRPTSLFAQTTDLPSAAVRTQLSTEPTRLLDRHHRPAVTDDRSHRTLTEKEEHQLAILSFMKDVFGKGRIPQELIELYVRLRHLWEEMQTAPRATDLVTQECESLGLSRAVVERCLGERNRDRQSGFDQNLFWLASHFEQSLPRLGLPDDVARHFRRSVLPRLAKLQKS